MTHILSTKHERKLMFSYLGRFFFPKDFCFDYVMVPIINPQ